ncbi:hypothetical protein [Pseudobdellovibrio exovorus]|uniref:Type II secretion system protein GspF domain-containing protein n=1 Tax=Pseudobdellovibrio exovorus JSS TaxID=1184267 RepID=M4VBV5_9BACT|nr:hypothetical protein [Pseudobdellovibrio exovorus]AGH96718.1 hypothetical protein A11Q_2502 [Pseudobdellovibrio exovorus JSS]
MFVELIVSLFGTVIIHRNLSLVEKLEVLSVVKLRVLFCFLQLPLCAFLFFKEQIHLVIIYIGIFLITLILHDKIIAYFDQKTFEKLHFNIIERLILLFNSGKSSSTCVKIVWNEFNAREKRIFFQLQHLFEVKNEKNGASEGFKQHFFTELKTILSSSTAITEQLHAFREVLRVQNQLQRRSRQILQHVRAQAVVASLIYLFFCMLSISFLNLKPLSSTFISSLALFLTGQLWIFNLGKAKKWKT